MPNMDVRHGWGSQRSPQPTSSALRAAIDQPLRQQRDGAAGGQTLATLIPSGAGDVQVGPALTVGKARQEACGSDRAGTLATNIGDVGKTGIELCLIVVPQ